MQRAVQLDDRHVFAGKHLAVEHPRNRQPPQIIAVVEIGNKNLQRSRCIALRRRDRLQNRIEQRTQILAALHIGRSRARLGVRV